MGIFLNGTIQKNDPFKKIIFMNSCFADAFIIFLQAFKMQKHKQTNPFAVRLPVGLVGCPKLESNQQKTQLLSVLHSAEPPILLLII